jgi:hypothetical protein
MQRLTPKFSRMRRRRNSPPLQRLAPHVGCNAHVRRSDGAQEPTDENARNAGAPTGCGGGAHELRGGPGLRVRVPVNGCLSLMAKESIRVRAPGLPQRSCHAAPTATPNPLQAASAQPCAVEGHGPAAPNAKVQPHAAPTQLR